MSHDAEHQGRVVAIKDERGFYTLGYVVSCRCGWQSTERRDRGETALRDLLEHIQTSTRVKETA